MKKSSKRFTISTEAKNSHGFRVRTEGVDLTDFRKNPLLLWMHQRPKGERSDEILPLGYWADIEVKDGKITGVPMFDESDPFAMKIYNKVENGTIKMASAGLKPGTFKTEGADKWLWNSSIQEGSLCDIGSNKEALGVALYNEENELVKLADFEQTFKTKSNTMKSLELPADAVLPLLKLNEGANAADAHEAILKLVTTSNNQAIEIVTLKQEKTDLKKELDDLKKADESTKITALVDKAVEDRKITADQKDSMIKLAESNYDSAKSYLESLTPAPTVASQTGKGGDAAKELMKLSWQELDAQGKLIQLKEENFEGFKEKFKEEFKTEYK